MNVDLELNRILKGIHKEMQDPSNWTNLGFCESVNRELNTNVDSDYRVQIKGRLNRLLGYLNYPVNHPYFSNNYDAYCHTSAEEKWDRENSEYARNRWRLLEELIEETRILSHL